MSSLQASRIRLEHGFTLIVAALAILAANCHVCSAAEVCNLLVSPQETHSAVCNIKVVTDGNPDYTDIGSMLHSTTSNWTETKDKCWALWYWNHIARRQTAPMIVHGRELTDPIRQFNDYGYTMCSTVAGVNCGIWGAMGLSVKFWDISLHTVPEVEYDGRWHMVDSSMSALYTLCDGTTIAGVEDIGAEGVCTAGGVRATEPSGIEPTEPGDVTAERPTLKCLGVRWLIGGDGNANARVAVTYRKLGSETWKGALDLFRVETAAIREPNRPPAGRTMFAGSVFDLDEDTDYEVKLSLKDPDGGDAQRVLRMRTWAEPRLSPDAPRRDVYPGQLAKALLEAKPGQVLRLHGGVYRGTFRPNSGTAGRSMSSATRSTTSAWKPSRCTTTPAA